MDEKKENNVAQGGQEGQGMGGRRKRRRHRGGHGGNNQNPNSQNGNPQNNQNAQAQNNQNPNGQNGQKNGQKNGQNGGHNQSRNKNGGNDQNQNRKNDKQNGGHKDKQKENKQPQPIQQQPQKQKNQDKNKGKEKQHDPKKEENRKDTYLYVLDGNLYVNLTNKCSNACDFCVRNERSSYYGNYLWIRHGDPTVEKVIAAANGFGDLTRFKEAVFCGFGEPTYKVAEMVALCDYFHSKGLKTRLNTNGQGNLINKRDIVPDLKGKIDFVNVSLNASCVEKYQPICRSQFRESGFEGMLEFAKLCRRNGVPCRFSIVDCIGEEEVEACKRLADSLNVPLYVRKYLTDS